MMDFAELAYKHAVKKHPIFDEGEGLFKCASILFEEVGEVAQALNNGDHGHAAGELYHVIAVCFRLIEELYYKQTGK